MYGANTYLTPSARLLLARLRRVLQAEADRADVEVSFDDSAAISLAIHEALERRGVSSACNAGMLTGAEPEPA